MQTHNPVINIFGLIIISDLCLNATYFIPALGPVIFTMKQGQNATTFAAPHFPPSLFAWVVWG